MKTAKLAWLALAAFAMAAVPVIRSEMHSVTVRDISNPPPSVAAQMLADISNPPPSVLPSLLAVDVA